jgi:hypothetical protein
MPKCHSGGRFRCQFPKQAFLIAGPIGAERAEQAAAAEGQLGPDEPAASRCLPGRGAHRLRRLQDFSGNSGIGLGLEDQGGHLESVGKPTSASSIAEELQ